jgi:hypothetical protein
MSGVPANERNLLFKAAFLELHRSWTRLEQSALRKAIKEQMLHSGKHKHRRPALQNRDGSPLIPNLSNVDQPSRPYRL